MSHILQARGEKARWPLDQRALVSDVMTVQVRLLHAHTNVHDAYKIY
jgi:hypothetical protein